AQRLARRRVDRFRGHDRRPAEARAMTSGQARAVAHANIALAKYWGKSSISENLPAVPSLSLTLSPLRTITRVRFDKTLERDRATLDGVSLVGRPLERIADLLARVRAHTQRE